MKGTREVDRTLERLLAQHAAPAPERVHTGIERVRGRLRSGVVSEAVDDSTGVNPAARRVRSRVLVAAAAVLFLAAAGLLSRKQIVSQGSAPAVVEAGESSIYLVSDGQTRPLQPNEPVAFGEIVRSNGGAGGMLRLADGSRVEVRSQSELTFERADDGVRIRLGKGGIIVNAAKQLAGHLYVQTKDVTVSIVGTVFLVNAEEQGSRVAVIEGEVRVKQGATEKKLTRGEQVATNPTMAVPPVIKEIAWSRNAAAHQALLLQSPVAPATPLPPSKNPADEPLTFEEISVRPTGVTVKGQGRGGVSRSPCSELFLDTARDGSNIFRVQLDPRRLAILKTTLYTLIAWAHGKDCDTLTLAGLLTGGPDWARSDEWDIQALIPEGGATYTARQFFDGHAPELQARLRNLLAKRFQLIVRTETRDVPVYVLTLGDKPLKLRPRLENTGPGAFTRRKDELGQPYAVFMNIPESNFARTLRLATGRMVLDRTGLKDGFYLDLEFAPLAVTGISSRPSLFRALEEVGLRLEEAKVPQDALVIERVERPSEN